MLRIVVLNPKGGSGKSTIAINLASYFASQGKQTCLLDCDPQGSSNYWLSNRPTDLPAIDSLSDTQRYTRSTRTWMITPRRGTEVQIVDTPARPDLMAMGDLLRKADRILIPVLPSELDMDVARHFVGEIVRTLRLPQPDRVIGLCANRVKPNTLVAARLNNFLDSLPIPRVASFRDSQNYLRASAEGLGLFEMDKRQTRTDRAQWQALLDWVNPPATTASVQAFAAKLNSPAVAVIGSETALQA